MVFLLVFDIPALILHYNYWQQSKNKIVQIDSVNMLITINDLVYKFDDIKYVILTRHTGYKHGEPTRKGPWSDYFYYQIDFKNNDRLILTSLMLKQKDFPFSVKHNRFKMFQKIDKFDYDRFIEMEIKISKKMKDERLNLFLEKYKDYSKNDLLEIIDNSSRYENTAVIAAKELIKK